MVSQLSFTSCDRDVARLKHTQRYLTIEQPKHQLRAHRRIPRSADPLLLPARVPLPPQIYLRLQLAEHDLKARRHVADHVVDLEG